MNRRTVGFILLSLMILTFSAEILANGSSLNFHGMLVAHTCEVRGARDVESFKSPQIIQVSSPIAMAVDAAANACGDSTKAISASCSSIPGASDSNSCVVTLTYQ